MSVSDLTLGERSLSRKEEITTSDEESSETDSEKIEARPTVVFSNELVEETVIS